MSLFTNKTLLITGGTGFIGSHAVVEFLEAGRELVVVDNFLNSKPVALERVKQITGKDFKFYEGDVRDEALLKKIFAENEIGAGHGADKLALVTEWFEKKAPWIYKIILSLFGKENLKDLIEDALDMIEDNFGKKKKN